MRTKRRVLLPIGLTGCVWAMVAAVEYFWIPLGNLWILAFLVYYSAYVIAAVVTVWAAIDVWRHTVGVLWMPLLLAVAAAAAAGIQAIDWIPAYVHGNYRLNRAAFAAVAALHEDGRLDSDDYYGAPLPWHLKYLARGGTAATITAFYGTVVPAEIFDQPSRTALFLAVYAGIPDGGAGYIYVGDSPPAPSYDCFADPCDVRWPLGDGWYWVH